MEKIAKVQSVDIEHGIVLGWAITCKVNGEDYYDLNIDKHEDGTWEIVPEHIPESTMFKCAAQFMESPDRPGNDMHQGPDMGQYLFMMPMTDEIAKAFGMTTRVSGLMVGYKPPPHLLEKYVSGEYTGFSIEGVKLAFEDIPS